MEHTQGRISFYEDGEANRYLLLDQNLHWLLSVIHNGEAVTDRQRANLRRLAACWNACEGITTDDIEAGKHAGLIRTIYAKNAAGRHRERLLQAVTGLLALHGGQPVTDAMRRDAVEFAWDVCSEITGVPAPDMPEKPLPGELITAAHKLVCEQAQKAIGG